METQPIDIFALKSNQQTPEFVNPREVPFNDEPMLVHLPVEIPFASPLDALAVAFVFWDVGPYAPIPQHFPRFAAVKTTIGIEYGTVVAQSKALQIFEELPDGLLELIAIIMVASEEPYEPNNIALLVDHWQNIAGLRFLSALIGDTFAPFFAIV